jgi:magnesium transporter
MQEVKSAKIKWIDIMEPNADDVLSIQKKYKLHPLVVEEFSTPTLRPKASEYESCMYLAIHVPLFDTINKTTYPGEIDIVICGGTLITAHDKDIYQLTEIFKDLKASGKQREKYMSTSPGALLHSLMEMLLESCFPKLDHITKKLDYIEEEIFAGHEKEMVLELSLVKRDILNFRRTMKPQRSVFESLAQKEYHLIESNLKAYFQDLVGTNVRVWNALESAKETVESLEATNNSLLSNKLNMTMKVLTIFSAIMLPLTVYSNIMSMSVTVPLHASPLAFWFHVGMMLVLAVVTYALFKLRKWL